MKRALLDTFSRKHDYLRISLTERCNLRCQYCMPEQGVSLTPSSELLTKPEIIRIVELMATLGIHKVRLTGGEPLLFPHGIVDLAKSIRSIPGITTLGMTTNGILLHRYLPELVAAGLNRLNISLDTLDDSKFLLITRRNGYGKVMDAIRMAEMLGIAPVKINCVVMRGVNDDEVAAMAALTKERPVQVRFIEFMPFDDNHWSRGKMVPFMETFDAIERGLQAKLKPYLGGERNETARLFHVEGHQGSIGFITSMTTHFCGTCNRLRLTADGNLKTCLFGDDEVSLRDPMRQGASNEDLEEIIRVAVSTKHFAHGGKKSPEALALSQNRPMIKIGG